MEKDWIGKRRVEKGAAIARVRFEGKSRAKRVLGSTPVQEVLGFSIQNVSPSAEGEALRNGGCGACSVHARSMGGKLTIGLATSGMFVCCCVDVACGCSIEYCVLQGCAIHCL